MSRNKLLTIRIEEEKRLAFNNWCEARDYSYSKFLYKVIESCLSGRIDESIFSGEPVDNDLGSKLLNKIEQVDESIDKRISENLVNYLDNKVDKHLDSKLDSRIDKTVDKYLDSKLNKAIANISVPSALPDNVPTKEDIDKAITQCRFTIAEKIQNSEGELSEYLDNKMNTAIALLKEEIKPILESQQEIEKLSQNNDFINAIATEVKK